MKSKHPQAEKQPAAFELNDVCRAYRVEHHAVPVLRGVSLKVLEGEWIALVGASGSGKTTLLHLLGTLDDPNDGTIMCRGRDYRTMSSRQKAALRRNEIGLVFQNYHLFTELSALENVALPALQWGSDRKAAREQAESLLVEFGLEQRIRHRPQELSGGEQQRVAMARALVNDPDIILADEPTGNLDEEAGSRIMGILDDLHKKQNKTIIMVTHETRLTRAAGRILTIRDGQVHPA